MSNENKECLEAVDDNNSRNNDNKKPNFLSRSWSFMNEVENVVTSSYNKGFFHGLITGLVASMLAYRSFK